MEHISWIPTIRKLLVGVERRREIFITCWDNACIINLDGTGSCQLTILKLHPEICQIRLDFEQFALAGKWKKKKSNNNKSLLQFFLSSGPDIQNHICNSDQFLVSGGSIVPVLCGTSNGDHCMNQCAYELLIRTIYLSLVISSVHRRRARAIKSNHFNIIDFRS